MNNVNNNKQCNVNGISANLNQSFKMFLSYSEISDLTCCFKKPCQQVAFHRQIFIDPPRLYMPTPLPLFLRPLNFFNDFLDFFESFWGLFSLGMPPFFNISAFKVLAKSTKRLTSVSSSGVQPSCTICRAFKFLSEDLTARSS